MTSISASNNSSMTVSAPDSVVKAVSTICGLRTWKGLPIGKLSMTFCMRNCALCKPAMVSDNCVVIAIIPLALW